MHELGIVFHVIKSVEEIAQENELTKVSTVTLSIGEVSGIVPSYLTDCWRWAADLAAGAGVGSVSGATVDMSGVGLFMAYLTTSSCSRRWSTTILSMMVFTRMSISDPSV